MGVYVVKWDAYCGALLPEGDSDFSISREDVVFANLDAEIANRDDRSGSRTSADDIDWRSRYNGSRLCYSVRTE